MEQNECIAMVGTSEERRQALARMASVLEGKAAEPEHAKLREACVHLDMMFGRPIGSAFKQIEALAGEQATHASLSAKLAQVKAELEKGKREPAPKEVTFIPTRAQRRQAQRKQGKPTRFSHFLHNRPRE